MNLKQNRVYAKDCEECESKEGFVYTIEREVKLIGNIGDAQRNSLIEISDSVGE